MSAAVSTLSAFFVVLAVSAFVAGFIYAMASRVNEVQRVTDRSEVRMRRHELHWTAIRLRNQGYTGEDLQEIICRETNCSPTDADAAIMRVGADL